MILTIDIGGTFIKYAFFKDGNMLSELMMVETDSASKKNTLDMIISIYKEKENEIEGLAISTPGSVTEDGYLNGYTAIKGWDNFNIVEELKGIGIKKPITVINDGNAAVLAEFKPEEGDRNVAAIAIGSGMGAGIIVNGELVVGKDGFGGELGYMSSIPVKWGETLMSFESGSGSSGFHSMQRKFKDLTGKELSGKEIFDLFDKKDKDAKKLIDEFYFGIAITLWNLTFSLNLEKIYISGGLTKREKAIDEIRRYFQELLDFRGIKVKNIVKIEKAKNGYKSGLVGAYKKFELERGKYE